MDIQTTTSKTVRRRVLLLCCLLPLVTFMPSRSVQAQQSPDQQQAAPLATVTSLPIQSLSGTSLDIATAKGWRVVYIWSALCPCVRLCETESLIPLAHKYAGQVEFYAVMSSKLDQIIPADTLSRIIATHNLPYPVYTDLHQKTADALGAQIAAQVFLIDPDNQVLYEGMVDDSRDYESRTDQLGVTKTYLADALSEALAGKPILIQKTPIKGCVICRG